jgi:glutaryl-CoA dehydrogenase
MTTTRGAGGRGLRARTAARCGSPTAAIADVAVVFARRDDDRIHGFLVERDTPGLTVRDVKGKLSMRASITSELVFEGCRIPASNMLPEAKGLRAALSCLSQARYGIAFGAIGAAQACFAEALRYCGDRVQFGERPISSHQLVQHALVEMYSRIVQGQLLALHLARLKEQGSLDPVAISLAKRNNVDAARFVARAARDLLGANGIVDEYCVMRHMCNLETVHTYEGTFNIHTLIVGQALTGESAFC